MTARTKEAGPDAGKDKQTGRLLGQEDGGIPAQGEYSFYDSWSRSSNTFVDGRRVKVSGTGLAKLWTYDPESGECLIRREARRPDQLAPYLLVEFSGKTNGKEAVAAFKNMGGGLDLNVVIKQFDPNCPGQEPALEFRASYRARAWPIQLDEDESDRRKRMLTNPHWRPNHLAVKGRRRDDNGHLIESYRLETKQGIQGVTRPHGWQEKYSRDRQGRLQQTERNFYDQGYLQSSTVRTHDPESEDVLVTQDIKILPNHFHDLCWDDRPHRQVETIDHQTKEVKTSYELLTPQDLQALEGPEMPRLSDHVDVLPSIEIAELNRLFDELRLELGDKIMGSDEPELQYQPPADLLK